MKMKAIGWVGYADGRPTIAKSWDGCGGPADTLDVYRLKKDAKLRFSDVRRVYVSDMQQSRNSPATNRSKSRT